MANSREKGVIVVIAFLALGILLLLSAYLLSFTIVESKTAASQEVSVKTYYLAEAGINEIIWKINNNEAVKNNFLNGTLGPSDGINRTDAFGDHKITYAVSALSTAAGEANLVATSTYQIAGRQSRRVVRVYITKASGESSPWDFAMFSGIKGQEGEGNIEISGTGAKITISGNRLHANNDIKLTGSNATAIVNNGAITAGDAIRVSGSHAQIILNNSYQSSPTSTIGTAPIDFDAWAAKSTLTYTAQQFKNLPSGTVLNGIVYVSEAASLNGSNYHLTVNGLLIINGYLQLNGSNITLTVNNNPGYGGGLMVNGNLRVSGSSAYLTVDGLIYVCKEFEVNGSNARLKSTGAMIAGNIKMSGSNIVADISYEPQYFQPVLAAALNPNAPVVQMNHWEEEY